MPTGDTAKINIRVKPFELSFGSFRFRLASVAYMIHIRQGTLDKPTLNWLRPIALNYSGLNSSDGLLKIIDGLLHLSDEELAAQSQQNKSPLGMAPRLQKYGMPLLESRLGSLRLRNMDLLNHLLEVSAQLAMFNDDVEQSRYFAQLSYGQVSEQNYERAISALDETQKNAAYRAKIVAELIGRIAW